MLKNSYLFGEIFFIGRSKYLVLFNIFLGLRVSIVSTLPDSSPKYMELSRGSNAQHTFLKHTSCLLCSAE